MSKRALRGTRVAAFAGAGFTSHHSVVNCERTESLFLEKTTDLKCCPDSIGCEPQRFSQCAPTPIA
jgi:hypothetical protein